MQLYNETERVDIDIGVAKVATRVKRVLMRFLVGRVG